MKTYEFESVKGERLRVRRSKGNLVLEHEGLGPGDWKTASPGHYAPSLLAELYRRAETKGSQAVNGVGPFPPPPAPGFERSNRREDRQRAVADALLALYANDGPDDYTEIDAADVYELVKADGGLGELGRIMAFARRLHYEIDQRYDGAPEE